MIRDKSNRKAEIDISGPAGNAFALLGIAMRYARQLDIDEDIVRAEMESGDYDNLIDTFDKYFGDYVDLVK